MKICNYATFPPSGRRVCKKRVGHKEPCVFEPDPVHPARVDEKMVRRLKSAINKKCSTYPHDTHIVVGTDMCRVIDAWAARENKRKT